MSVPSPAGERRGKKKKKGFARHQAIANSTVWRGASESSALSRQQVDSAVGRGPETSAGWPRTNDTVAFLMNPACIVDAPLSCVCEREALLFFHQRRGRCWLGCHPNISSDFLCTARTNKSSRRRRSKDRLWPAALAAVEVGQAGSEEKSEEKRATQTNKQPKRTILWGSGKVSMSSSLDSRQRILARIRTGHQTNVRTPPL